MKKLFLLLLLLSSFSSYAQQDMQVSHQLLAYQQVKNTSTPVFNYGGGYGRGNKCVNGFTVTGNILAAAGGALIGWPLGTAVGGGDPEWILAGVGAGVLAVAIPLAIVGQRRCSGGGRRYGALQPENNTYNAFKKTKELGIVATGNTIGLQLSF